MENFDLKLAYELTIFEFCEVCRKKGLTPEEVKAEILKNVDAIAERIKSISK